MTNVIDYYMKEAALHLDRMTEARGKIEHLLPITPGKIEGFSFEELAAIEMYTSRFCKLQDLLGAKIFPEILNIYGENIQELFFIDRLNRLEKMGVIESAQEWVYMRKLRNQFAHEYPDMPEFLANNLNIAFDFDTKLIDCLRTIEKLLKK